MVGVLGFSFSGQGQNAGLAFVTLKDWDEREGAEHIGAGARRPRLRRAVGHPRRLHLPAQPAADPRARHRLRLHLPPAGPRRQRPRRAGRRAQPAARPGGAEQGARRRAPRRPGGRAAAADRHRPRQGQRARRRRSTRSTPRSRPRSARRYVNDFPNARPPAARGRAGRRAGAHAARRPAAPERGQQRRASWCRCRPSRPRAGSPARCRPSATTAIRRCASPATPRPGYSTGDAMAEMERLAAQLPPGFGYEWTGQSREEKLAGAQAADPAIGFSLLAVFLCLAALYESWSIPLVGDPGGAARRARRACSARRCAAMPNDVYFKVGLITIIGLSAKNAILIIEFAKDLHAQGKGAGRGGARGGAPALPADPHDLARLHPRRAAAGARDAAPARPASARSAPA